MEIDLNINHRKELISLIRQLSEKHGTWQIFEDFLALSAISMSNSVDWTHRAEREKQYLEIVRRYEKSELELFPEMLANLVNEMEKHAEVPTDVLGSIFHELELHNKYKGQFFTPQHISDMMGKITLNDDRAIAEHSYLSVCEPCCGSGVMVLGFAKAMQDCKLDYHRQMVVTATDIDIKCVYMTYIQLSLYGIPAVVIHGNSLTLEEWSRWYTPVYMVDGWIWRQSCGNLNKRYPEDEAIKRANEPLYAAMRDVEALFNSPATVPDEIAKQPETYDVDLKECKNGQLSFF